MRKKKKKDDEDDQYSSFLVLIPLYCYYLFFSSTVFTELFACTSLKIHRHTNHSSHDLPHATHHMPLLQSKLKSSASACDSDDVHSETSSVCSDNSAYWNCGRQVTEVAGVRDGIVDGGMDGKKQGVVYGFENGLVNNKVIEVVTSYYNKDVRM